MREYEKRCKERKEYLRQRGKAYLPTLIRDMQKDAIRQEKARQDEEIRNRAVTAYLASQPWI